MCWRLTTWRTFRFSDETKLWFNRFGAKKASVVWQIDSIDWHWTDPDWFITNGQRFLDELNHRRDLQKDGSFFGEFEPLKRNLLLSKIESIPRWVRNRELGHNSSTKDNVGRHLNSKRRYKCFNLRPIEFILDAKTNVMKISLILELSGLESTKND